MTPELWERLKPLFHAALDCEIGDRAAFIADTCGNDSELKDNLVRLLKAAQEPTRSFDAPLVHFTLSLGSRFKTGEVLLGRFSIVGPVGSGGMGEVYEAWDCELRDLVALKTIRPEIARDFSVIERFKEEVKQARQIAHPNVCRVYDLFSYGEPPGGQAWFLTMQLLQGTTLQERIRQEGPFSKREAVALIEQMVAGLAAAHELGVIHRDFKSSNVMLVPGADKQTHAVITDFGLATRIPTVPDPIRLKGQGTPVYVAPEQWQDGIVGPEADQYSLGVVICEMITGERPIREYFDSARSSVIRMPAGANLLGGWEKAIRRCLEIRPEDRFRSVTAVLTALVPRRRRRPLVRWITAAVSLPLLPLVIFQAMVTPNRNPTIRDLKQLTPDNDLSTSPSLSRDGSTIAYASDRSGAGGSDIWVQHLPDGAPTQVTNDAAGNDEPSLSPDGRTVAFSSSRDPNGIYIADTNSGVERLLIPEGKSPKISPDGRSALYWIGDYSELMPSGRIFVADLATGKSTQLAPGFAEAHEPIWNSDGRHILFTGCPSEGVPVRTCWDWWTTTIDGAEPRSTGAMSILNARGLRPVGGLGGWYENAVMFTGTLRGVEHLWELAVSPTDGMARGEPRELTAPEVRAKVISSSRAGNNVLAFTELSSSAIHIWRIANATQPKSVKASKVTSDAEMDMGPSVSPHGLWLTFARGLSEDREILVVNIQSGATTQFHAVGPDKRSPLVDDSATTLAYESWDNRVPSVYIVRQDGSPPNRICTRCQSPTSWINGNEGLLLSDAAAAQINVYWLASGQSQTILAKPGARLGQATWSPANEHILFTSIQGEGKAMAFAVRFHKGAMVPDGPWIPMTDPSESVQVPRWSGDGKTIFYLSDRNNSCCLWAQHFDPRAGRPEGKPFPVHHFSGQRFSPYVIASGLFNLSAAGDSVYLNVADLRGTIWTGKLDLVTNPHPLDLSRFYQRTY